MLDVLHRSEPRLLEELQDLVTDAAISVSVRRAAMQALTTLAMLGRQRRAGGRAAGRAPRAAFFAACLARTVAWMNAVRPLPFSFWAWCVIGICDDGGPVCRSAHMSLESLLSDGHGPM